MQRKLNSKLYDCDRCMFTYKKTQLRRQRGMLLCEECFDTTLEIAPINVKWGSPRDNATTVTAVNLPTVYTLTNIGITELGNSNTRDREGRVNTYNMQVQGTGGNAFISTIAAGTSGTILVLEGVSDVNPVVIMASAGIELHDSAEGLILYDGSTMTLVYSVVSARWLEASRNLVGVYVTPPVPPVGPSLYNDDFAYNTDVSYIGV